MLEISHRGAGGLGPENTHRSFKIALKYDIDMIETDLWLSKDNKLVINHDSDLKRIYKVNKKIKDLTLDEIKSINSDIPSLEEVFALVDSKVQLNLEIKTPEVVKYLIKEIKDSDYPVDKLLISSNYLNVLNIVKQEIPSIRIAWIFHSIGSSVGQFFWSLMVVKVLFLVQNHVVKKIQDNNIKILVLHKVLATKRFIDKLHKLKIKVLIWTVDGKEQIIKYRNKGVDGIISNYPNKF